MALTHYEIMLLYTPELAETAVKKEITLFKKRITDDGGEITFEDFWGKRELAYPINKKTSGFYSVLQFTLSGENIRTLEEDLRLDSKVLRQLVTKVPVGHDESPLTYKEIMEEYDDFVSEKVSGKRKVRKLSHRKESIDKSA